MQQQRRHEAIPAKVRAFEPSELDVCPACHGSGEGDKANADAWAAAYGFKPATLATLRCANCGGSGLVRWAVRS